MKPRGVLIVEDEEDIREMLREFLLRDGYHVRVAKNGREALELLNTPPTPDVILLDLMMPVMSGEDLLESLRSEPAWKTIPVIVLTAANIHEEIGGAAIVRKPFRMQQIRAALTRIWAAAAETAPV